MIPEECRLCRERFSHTSGIRCPSVSSMSSHFPGYAHSRLRTAWFKAFSAIWHKRSAVWRHFDRLFGDVLTGCLAFSWSVFRNRNFPIIPLLIAGSGNFKMFTDPVISRNVPAGCLIHDAASLSIPCTPAACVHGFLPLSIKIG